MTEKPKDPPSCECLANNLLDDGCPPVENVTHPLRYYEFTPDEIKVLEECDKESFYQRCLPFSTLFATITYAAIRAGFLPRNPHFGAVPKLLFAGLVGHAVGRLSMRENYDKKIREKLPGNSYLANTMRMYEEERNPNPKKKKKYSRPPYCKPPV